MRNSLLFQDFNKIFCFYLQNTLSLQLKYYHKTIYKIHYGS